MIVSEHLKGILDNEEFLRISINIITGTIAGLLVVVLFYPLEYIETIMHLRLIESRDIHVALKQEYNKGGLSNLYKGGIASIIG